MFERILVPVDGSTDSWVALEQAILIAHEGEHEIYGLFVVDIRLIEAPYITSLYSDNFTPSINPAAVEMSIEVSQRLEARAQTVLTQLKDRCTDAGIRVQAEKVDGLSSQIILARAQEADLIVMGRRGEGARWAGPLLGSTFEAVVRHVPIPVIATQAEIRPTTRILVAYDGSEISRGGLAIAKEMAVERGLSIVLLTVDDGHPGRKEAHEFGRVFLLDQELNVKPLFYKGHPAEEILDVARTEGCDLIILGAYGHSRFLEIFFGSSVDEVIHEATCPLLICR